MRVTLFYLSGLAAGIVCGILIQRDFLLAPPLPPPPPRPAIILSSRACESEVDRLRVALEEWETGENTERWEENHILPGTSNRAFVRLLYVDLLGREPEVAANGWVRWLDRGNTRGWVAWHFVAALKDFGGPEPGIAPPKNRK